MTSGSCRLNLLAHRLLPSLLARLASMHRAILSRTLRNGRICQSMAGFWGGTDFVSEMSSEILRIDSVELTHRSASYEKQPHLLTPVWRSTRVAVGYGPLIFSTWSMFVMPYLA
jgi:hypothetical protein